MSKIKQILIISLVALIVYILWKPELLKKIPYLGFLYNLLKRNDDNETEHFDTFTGEKLEEKELSYSSPTLNPLELKQIINYKNTLIKPYTQISNQPTISNYKSLSDLDFKNLQGYIVELFSPSNCDNIIFNILPKNISPNIYYTIDSNVLFITPIELEGQLFINNKPFGIINLMLVLRGSTNKLYVPKNGFFVNDTKFEPYVETIKINSVQKNNSNDRKEDGFYAVADTINYKVDNPEDVPLKKLAELEDSEEDNLNLSEFIQDNEIERDSENETSIDINY